MIEHFKMVRITCDVCGEKSFEVFTFESSVQAPEGWMEITTSGGYYISTRLGCPDCVKSASRDGDTRINKPYYIDITYKRDGESCC
jgi:hypothetical protein